MSQDLEWVAWRIIQKLGLTDPAELKGFQWEGARPLVLKEVAKLDLFTQMKLVDPILVRGQDDNTVLQLAESAVTIRILDILSEKTAGPA